MANYKAHLQRQLSFLSRSCESYDAGYEDEAIRIATVLRVLIHQTRQSTSLLRHLEAEDIKLLSTTMEPGPSAVYFVGMGMMTIGGSGNSYRPSLGDGPPVSQFLPVSKWWEQRIMVLDPSTQLTRKSTVLAAVNKDGGAHIDEKLTKEYEALSADGAVGTFVQRRNGNEYHQPIQAAHLVSIRQMGYEILNSPELLALKI